MIKNIFFIIVLVVFSAHMAYSQTDEIIERAGEGIYVPVPELKSEVSSDSELKSGNDVLLTDINIDNPENSKLKLSSIVLKNDVNLGNLFSESLFRIDTLKKDKDNSFFGSERSQSAMNSNIQFDSSFRAKKNYWLPVVEIFFLNIGVWSISRYIVPQPWAVISTQTVKANFNHAFVWDSDHFSTNQLMHPYHGNTYFNFARSSGLTFWESAPYSFAGSFMWEFFMEVNYPSMNDLITTTMGGIALGEMTYRLSSLIIDERTSGSERVWREIGAFLVAPTRAINRFFKGDVTRVRSKSIYEIEPVASSVEVGPSFTFQKGSLFKGTGNLSLRLDMYYGNPFTEKLRKPYDFFNFKGLFSIGTQPLVSQVSVYGLLFGKNYKYKSDQKMLIGMFQHFDYYHSTYYEIGANSLGAGLIYKFPTFGDVSFESSLHIAGIVLGGGNNVPEAYKYEADGTAYRDYNFGSGFANKFENYLGFKNKGYLFLGLYNFMIYTIDGAAGRDNLIIFTPRIGVKVTPTTDIGFEFSYYRRSSNYKKLNDVLTKVYEAKVFISNSF